MRDRTRSFWQNHPMWSLLIAAIVIVGLTIVGVKYVPKAWAWATDDRPAPSQELLDAATVTTPTIKCKQDDPTLGTVNMRIESSMPVGTGPSQRWWGDSVALPMADNDQVLSLGQIMDTVCHDPHYGHVVANALAETYVGNVSLVSRNDWLKSLSLESIPTSAAAYMPTLNLEDKSFDQSTEAVKKNQEWQVAASYINTLLHNFANLGYHSPQSVWNYHLTGVERVTLPYENTADLATVGKNDKQENLRALVMGLTEKGQKCPILQIAFNTGDKRPEGVDICKEEAPKPVISTPAQPHNPTPTSEKPKPVEQCKNCGGPPPPPCCAPPPPPPPPPPCCAPPPETKGTVHVPMPQDLPMAPAPGPVQVEPNHPQVPNTGALPGAPNVQDPTSAGGVRAVDEGVHQQEPDVIRGSGGDVGNAPVNGAPTGDGSGGSGGDVGQAGSTAPE